MSKFKGIYPALVTPLTADNCINVEVLQQLVEYLLEKQVDGFYIGGTTGQGLFLSVDERKQLTEVVLKQVNGRVPVIVHVGAVAVVDAIVLARHACDQGASGISSLLLPQYPNLADLVAYVEALCSSVPLPFLAYIYGRKLNAVQLMQRLMQFETVIGSKYTGPNMEELKQVIALGQNGDWTVFSGMDEQSNFAAMMGSAGHIGSTLNLMPGVYRAIQDCTHKGDLAEAHRLQMRANAVTLLLLETDFASALNVALEKLGFACGQPRLPAKPFTPEQRRELNQALDASEFAELARF
jgi:N-acetylneuraminate lyase